ncbi:protein translocase subunit SecF [Nocardioides sp. KR10-350]|uniref:protein translocase subunit SecF n=1 Tax=Nocardioides cheoyonin TaxID=3156615 RepID=UPI0032B39612
MSKLTRLGGDLYTGRKSINFVGRKWLWYAISAVIIVVVVLGLSVKGLNLGIDFKGGTRYTVTISGQASQKLADQLRDAVGTSGVPEAETPTVMTAGDHSVVIETKTINENSADDDKVMSAITKTADVKANDISRVGVGASWGKQVATKAATGLVVFLVLVVLFIWGYFRQWKMSVAAVVALAHDVVITVGVYALSGFEVTPATVTGFLTILGFSLYDTVVVFDKVRENTKNLRATRRSYAEAANLALNQTLVRSVNTSIVALLPVIAILYVSAVQLGTSTLKDIALALFIGMAAGTYSSIFIATPLLVHLKSGEKEVVDAERRARARIKQADKYADVPVFTDDLPVADEPAELADAEPGPTDEADVDEPAGSRTASRPRSDPMGRGRTAPSQHRPVRESGASGRPQPSRKPRSKRGK